MGRDASTRTRSLLRLARDCRFRGTISASSGLVQQHKEGMDYLVGVDVGTGSCKVSITDEAGSTVGAASPAYGFDVPQAGWAEQDPATWWLNTVDTVREASARAGIQSRDRVFVGFTGQMHTVVLLDDRQRPLRPAILWLDQRSKTQAAHISRTCPDFARITGNAPLPAFTLPQLLWVREHEADLFDRIEKVMVPKDYLRLLCTGAAATEWTDASGMAMLDARTRRWSEELLAAFSIDSAILPDVNAPHSTAGDASSLFQGGVSATAAYGIGDQSAEALSGGLVEPEQALISLGTSAVLLGLSEVSVEGSFCHAPEDRWLRLDSLHSGGLSLIWFSDAFGAGASIGELLSEAVMAKPGSGGLLYLPFLVGERTSNGRLPAGFIGMRHDHTRAEFVRSVLEGVAFELRRMFDRQAGRRPISRLIVKGGGARSELWTEILGAVFAAQVAVSDRDAAYGAALIAGIAAGWWGGYSDLTPTYRVARDPAVDLVNAYAEHYQRYRHIVAVLEDVSESDAL